MATTVCVLQILHWRSNTLKLLANVCWSLFTEYPSQWYWLSCYFSSAVVAVRAAVIYWGVSFFQNCNACLLLCRHLQLSTWNEQSIITLSSLFSLLPSLSITFFLCPTFAGRHVSMGETHWFSRPLTSPLLLTPPVLLCCPKPNPPSLQSPWLPPINCWVWLRWAWSVTRRLRGDMRSFPQWSAPCSASLASSSASSVSEDVVKVCTHKVCAGTKRHSSFLGKLCFFVSIFRCLYFSKATTSSQLP